MVKFLSCDWGTSTLRLRLIQVPDLTVLAEVSSAEGISKTYSDWQATGLNAGINRVDFYLSVLDAHLQKLRVKAKGQGSLAGLPVVISGMASASIGMMELPYQPLPLTLDGANVTTKFIPAGTSFTHDVYLISGVSTASDVMRGEETQLIGFASLAPDEASEQLFIFPGTHAKHILVKQKQAISFKTYMTGEFFSLLFKNSILKASVTHNPDLPAEKISVSFISGVRAAKGANLLQAAFLVRTNELFQKFTKAENLHYLSGLLIGLELQELTSTSATIYLCGGANLHKPYATALQAINLPNNLHLYPPQLADEAVIRGQYQILKNQQPLI